MSGRMRNQRGVVLPSPVVMLSVIAVAMASIAFVATRGAEPTEREVTTVAREAQPNGSASESADASADQSPSSSAKPGQTKAAEPRKPRKPPKPVVERGKVYVEVYNNSGITGLAGQVAGSASGAGWQVVGSDNWYGTIPATTVYYPEKLKAAAKMLALDLGIHRTAPAVDPMRLDRLTVILTGPIS